MTMYITRNTVKRASGTTTDRFATIDAEGLQVTHPDRTRRVGRVTGLGPVMEKIGTDPDRIRLGVRRESPIRAVSDLGTPVSLTVNGGKPIPLTQVNRHVRQLTPANLETLASHDEAIAELEEKLKAARKARRAAVSTMWEQAGPVEPAELLEKTEDA